MAKGLEWTTVDLNAKGNHGLYNYAVDGDNLYLHIVCDEAGMKTSNGAPMFAAAYTTVKMGNGKAVRLNCQFYESVKAKERYNAAIAAKDAEIAKLKAELAKK